MRLPLLRSALAGFALPRFAAVALVIMPLAPMCFRITGLFIVLFLLMLPGLFVGC